MFWRLSKLIMGQGDDMLLLISRGENNIYIYIDFSVNGLRANTNKHTSGSHSEILQIRRKPWPVRLPMKSAFFCCEYHMICYDVPSPLTWSTISLYLVAHPS